MGVGGGGGMGGGGVYVWGAEDETFVVFAPFKGTAKGDPAVFVGIALMCFDTVR